MITRVLLITICYFCLQSSGIAACEIDTEQSGFRNMDGVPDWDGDNNVFKTSYPIMEYFTIDLSEKSQWEIPFTGECDPGKASVEIYRNLGEVLTEGDNRVCKGEIVEGIWEELPAETISSQSIKSDKQNLIVEDIKFHDLRDRNTGDLRVWQLKFRFIYNEGKGRPRQYEKIILRPMLP